MRRFLFLILCLSLIHITVYAHPGGTDGRGGHRNRSTGEYHYHHGYSAHDHTDLDDDGDVDCPYDFDDKNEYKSIVNKNSTSEKTIKTRSIWDYISAFLQSILPAFGLALMAGCILFNVFYFLFGEDIGWRITMISALVLFLFLLFRFTLLGL